MDMDPIIYVPLREQTKYETFVKLPRYISPHYFSLEFSQVWFLHMESSWSLSDAESCQLVRLIKLLASVVNADDPYYIFRPFACSLTVVSCL